jgi:hypothetical protein
MRRLILALAVSAVLGLATAAFAPDVALADQAFQTVRAPYHSLNEAAYPLQDGFVVAVHMNGPVNFEKKEFQLHGATPNTQFFIYRIFTEAIGPIPAGLPLYSGFSIWTDEHGNGHIITPLSPTNPSLYLAKSLGIDHLTITNVLYDGLLAKDGGTGGTQAYAADPFVTYFDFDWTP